MPIAFMDQVRRQLSQQPPSIADRAEEEIKAMEGTVVKV